MTASIPITEPFEVSNPTTQAFPQIMPSPATIVFRSAGPRGGNVYETWAQVAQAASGISGPRAIVVESIETLPASASDPGAGYSLSSPDKQGELRAVSGSSLATAPTSVDGLSLTSTSDTTSMFTVDSTAFPAGWRITNVYSTGTGAQPVITILTTVFADIGCFFDAGTFFVPAGTGGNVSLSGGSVFASGAFVFGDGSASVSIQILDAQSLQALLSVAPDISGNQITVTNSSGVTDYGYVGPIVFAMISATNPSTSGGWTVGFNSGSSLVSANLSSSGSGEFYANGPQQVLTAPQSVTIEAPPTFALTNLQILGGATDVPFFVIAGVATLSDCVVQCPAGKQPPFENSGVVRLFRSALTVAGESDPVLHGGNVEAWDGARIDAGALSAVSAIRVLGSGVQIATSYGALIELVPGVPFAGAGDPITLSITATDAGCVYVDQNTGIEWTSIPTTTPNVWTWRQVNASTFAYRGQETWDVIASGGFEGPWMVTFPNGTPDLLSADLSTPAAWSGTWFGLGGTGQGVVTGSVGVSIVPPQAFTIEHLVVLKASTDVVLFPCTDAFQSIALFDSSLEIGAGSGALPVVRVTAGTTTISLVRSTLAADGSTPSVQNDGGTLSIDVWEGGVIQSSAVDTVSGTTSFHARGAGAQIPIAYGAAIRLYPGVPFAAAGSPLVTAVTPTAAGCMYIDTATGVNWTFDGSTWVHP